MRSKTRAGSTAVAIGALVVVLSFAGCGTQRGTRVEPDSVNLDGAWELVSGTGPAGEVEIVELNRITLLLEDMSGGGRSGCNWYGAGRWTRDQGFDFDHGGATDMGCAPRVMAAEVAYVEALGDVDQATRTGDRLVLKGPASELMFKLNEPVSTEGLLDRTWILVETVEDGDSAPAIGTTTTFRMGSDGSIEWAGPCGDASGTWDPSGDEIDVPSWQRGSDTFCGRELRNQAAKVSAAFGGAFIPSVDGDRLEISSATSRALAIYRAG